MRHWTARRTAAGVLAAMALTVGIAGTALAAQQAVTISGFAFSPATITVKVGDTITWTNQDGVGHTATAVGGAFNTGVIASGASASVTLTKAGTFTYHCMIHPSMTGTVVVEAAAVATPRATTAVGGSTGATQPPTDTLVATGSATPTDGWAWLIVAAAVGAGFGSLLLAARRRAVRARR